MFKSIEVKLAFDLLLTCLPRNLTCKLCECFAQSTSVNEAVLFDKLPHALLDVVYIGRASTLKVFFHCSILKDMKPGAVVVKVQCHGPWSALIQKLT